MFKGELSIETAHDDQLPLLIRIDDTGVVQYLIIPPQYKYQPRVCRLEKDAQGKLVAVWAEMKRSDDCQNDGRLRRESIELLNKGELVFSVAGKESPPISRLTEEQFRAVYPRLIEMRDHPERGAQRFQKAAVGIYRLKNYRVYLSSKVIFQREADRLPHTMQELNSSTLHPGPFPKRMQISQEGIMTYNRGEKAFYLTFTNATRMNAKDVDCASCPSEVFYRDETQTDADFCLYKADFFRDPAAGGIEKKLRNTFCYDRIQ